MTGPYIIVLKKDVKLIEKIEGMYRDLNVTFSIIYT